MWVTLALELKFQDLLGSLFGLLSKFQYGFRSSRSAADLLTVVSDRNAKAFNRSGALDVLKAFGRVWYAGLLYKIKSYGISGRVFDFFYLGLSFLSYRGHIVVLDQKSLQEYLVNARVPQGFIPGPTLFL